MRPVQRPNAAARKPRLIAPPGACDTHLHIYGALGSYPLAPERNDTPDPHSTVDDYLKVRGVLGLDRAVIVTGSANGADNRVTVDALKRMDGKFKGLALLDPATSDPELKRFADSGITGFAPKPTARAGYLTTIASRCANVSSIAAGMWSSCRNR